jgi:hypothetical protein
MLLIKHQHRPRTVLVDHIPAHLRAPAILELEEHHQPATLISLNILYTLNLAFPVFALRHPGADYFFFSVGRGGGGAVVIVAFLTFGGRWGGERVGGCGVAEV